MLHSLMTLSSRRYACVTLFAVFIRIDHSLFTHSNTNCSLNFQPMLMVIITLLCLKSPFISYHIVEPRGSTYTSTNTPQFSSLSFLKYSFNSSLPRSLQFPFCPMCSRQPTFQQCFPYQWFKLDSDTKCPLIYIACINQHQWFYCLN